jgi:hypothetical protein
VRLELAKEVEAKARREMNEEEMRSTLSDSGEDPLPDLDTSPGEFLFFGLEIEQQQYVFLLSFIYIHLPSTDVNFVKTFWLFDSLPTDN